MRYMSVWVKPWELSDHPCECGCGEFTFLATKNFAPKGWVKGEPLRFLNGHAPRFHAKQRRERCPEGSPSGVLCACGCGQETPYDGRAHPRELVPGHRRPRPVEPKQLQIRFGKDRPKQFDIDGVTGCWVWRLKVETCGYGAAYVGGKRVKAHRHYYETYKGPIPEGFHVHHECENRLCVNPAHLLAVSPDEHTLIHLVRRNGADWVVGRVA